MEVYIQLQIINMVMKMIVSEIESAVNLLEKAIHYFRINKGEPSITERFILLFENHGVHRNQIPGFFGHGLEPKDIKSDEALLSVLTNEMMDDVCELFAVRREWLDGVDSQIYPLHDFYKNPEAFSEFLDKLLLRDDGSKERLHGVLLAPLIEDLASLDNEALIVLEEPVGVLGDKTICRYHLCNNWLFSYWKSRAYLASCVAIAWKKHVYIGGRKIDTSTIKKYCYGEHFLEHNGERSLPLHGVFWYPEDMAIHPEEFLKDIDPEKENYGLLSALDLWLKLEEDGLMDPDLPYEKTRQKYEDMRTEIQSRESVEKPAAFHSLIGRFLPERLKSLISAQ